MGLANIDVRKFFFVGKLASDAVPRFRMLDGFFIRGAEKHIAIADAAMADGRRCRRCEFAPGFQAAEAKG